MCFWSISVDYPQPNTSDETACSIYLLIGFKKLTARVGGGGERPPPSAPAMKRSFFFSFLLLINTKPPVIPLLRMQFKRIRKLHLILLYTYFFFQYIFKLLPCKHRSCGSQKRAVEFYLKLSFSLGKQNLLISFTSLQLKLYLNFENNKAQLLSDIFKFILKGLATQCISLICLADIHRCVFNIRSFRTTVPQFSSPFNPVQRLFTAKAVVVYSFKPGFIRPSMATLSMWTFLAQ
ncbi:hypothetical protein XENOCAPTIV_012125 [Xenoophorus captivus]|uniref:Uncharacterized protein n=1 Tax=Xenoophorus captivus TaxID=1517983 RepID=A0ABV0RGY6_9TELE